VICRLLTRLLGERVDPLAPPRSAIYANLRERGYDLVPWAQCREGGPMLLDVEWNHLLARLESSDVPTIDQEARNA
jgi:hypothetical protein